MPKRKNQSTTNAAKCNSFNWLNEMNHGGIRKTTTHPKDNKQTTMKHNHTPEQANNQKKKEQQTHKKDNTMPKRKSNHNKMQS